MKSHFMFLPRRLPKCSRRRWGRAIREGRAPERTRPTRRGKQFTSASWSDLRRYHGMLTRALRAT